MLDVKKNNEFTECKESTPRNLCLVENFFFFFAKGKLLVCDDPLESIFY